jgi:hypothetical protein
MGAVEEREFAMRSLPVQLGGLALLGGLLTFTICISHGADDNSSRGKDPAERLQPYLKVLHEKGQEPIRFVQDKLATHDLLIFDDALHDALEQ